MTKGIRLTKKLKTAMKRYYSNRKEQDKGGEKWDKAADLKNISSCLPRSVVHFQASAGTFWLTWKSGIQTTHDEKNYWVGKILRFPGRHGKTLVLLSE